MASLSAGGSDSSSEMIDDENPVVGDLTLSGMLYEGCNFKEWLRRVGAVLRVNPHVRHDPYGPGHMFSSRSLPEYLDFVPGQQNSTANIIKHHISPPIGARVPDLNDVAHPFRLLQKLAQPFSHFFDLPPEIRNRIYEETLEQTVSTPFMLFVDEGQDYSSYDYATDLPAILQTTRQLRHEVSSIFYAQRQFAMQVVNYGDQDMNEKLRCLLEAWITKGDHQHDLRHVRQFDIVFEWWCQPRPFKFRLSNACELTIEGPEELDDESKLLLLNHTRTMNLQIRLLDLRGEAIIMAMTIAKDLWTRGTLNFTDD